MERIYRRSRFFATKKRRRHQEELDKIDSTPGSIVKTINGTNKHNDLSKQDQHQGKHQDQDNDASKQANKSDEQASSSASASANASGGYDCLTPLTRSRLNTLAQIGEDWLYLALLGIIMALLSLSMDSVITLFLGTRIWLSEEASEQNLLLQYLAWCVTPILLVTFSTGFVHLCSPTVSQ